MPTVAVVEGVKVQFFFDDHPPPHFHAEIGWAESRRDELLRAWYDTAAGRKPGRLE